MSRNARLAYERWGQVVSQPTPAPHLGSAPALSSGSGSTPILGADPGSNLAVALLLKVSQLSTAQDRRDFTTVNNKYTNPISHHHTHHLDMERRRRELKMEVACERGMDGEREGRGKR